MKKRTAKEPKNSIQARVNRAIHKIFTASENRKYSHICWFAQAKKYRTSNDPKVRRMWVQMVLLRGKAEDIRELPHSEIKKFLPDLVLPIEIKKLWERYLKIRK